VSQTVVFSRYTAEHYSCTAVRRRMLCSSRICVPYVFENLHVYDPLPVFMTHSGRTTVQDHLPCHLSTVVRSVTQQYCCVTDTTILLCHRAPAHTVFVAMAAHTVIMAMCVCGCLRAAAACCPPRATASCACTMAACSPRVTACLVLLVVAKYNQ
jgi:hypothetical protein